MNDYNLNRNGSIVWQLVAYAFAILIAIYTYEHLPVKMDLALKILLSDIAATVIIFFFSYAFRNASIYDPYWSVQPIVIAIFLIIKEQAGVDVVRQLMVIGLILVWGLRLTWNFVRGWEGIIHEDWRYVQLRNISGFWFPLVSFFGIMLMPTLLVYLGCLPLFDALRNGHVPFGIFDVLAFLIAAAGIAFQWIADEQLLEFRMKRKRPHRILNTGLWKYSRHPNYFWGDFILGRNGHFWRSLSWRY